MLIPKLYRKFDCYDEYVPFPCIPLSGTTQMIVDISLTEGHESHHLGRIYRNAGKDLLSGLCHYPLSDAVLYLSAYSDSLQPAPKLSEKFFTAIDPDLITMAFKKMVKEVGVPHLMESSLTWSALMCWLSWRPSSSEMWVHHSSEIQPSYATRRQ